MEGAFVDSIGHGKRPFRADCTDVSRRGQSTDDWTMAPVARLTAENNGMGVFHGNRGTMMVDEQNTVAVYKRRHPRFQMGEKKPQAAGYGRAQWQTMDNENTRQANRGVEDIRSYFRRHPEHTKRKKGATPRQPYSSMERGSNQDLRANDSACARAGGKRNRNYQRAIDLQSATELGLPFDGVLESAAGYEGDSDAYCRRSPMSTFMTHYESPSEFYSALKITSRAGRAG